ncbi:MAG: C25 family peptidase propeptide domain-containing protein, partial [Bacteroidales bacterium]
MNKANFFLAGILFCIINLFTCWLTLYAQEVNFSIVSQTSESVIVKVDFPQYQVYTIDVKGKKMSKLIMKNAYPIEEAGAPELLKSATSILIPEGSHPTVSIIKSSYEIVPDFELVPSKGRLYRNVNPDDIPYTMGEQYRYNGFL